MGKMLSDNNSSLKDARHKRILKCKNSKYLKPGLLAQYRSCKAMIGKPYADMENKREIVLKDGMVDSVLQSGLFVGSPAMANSVKVGNVDVDQSNFLLKTPTATLLNNDPSESILESLPMDILVKIVCHLNHDGLKPAFHVSQRLRKAVLLAKEIHFNYKTPIRSQQELMCVRTPVPTEHWPLESQGSLNSVRVSSPHTPKAPRPAPRPPHIKHSDIRQIAAVLFPETSLSSRYMVPSVLQRTPCKAVAAHRVLFYEEELCQAVAQNKLH